MASQVTITSRLLTSHTDGTQAIDTGNVIPVVTLGGSRVYSVRMTITQAVEVVVVIATLFPNVGAAARYHIRNLDILNFVKFGFATGVYDERITKLEPKQGQFQATPTLYLIADNADCEIELTVVNA